MKQRFAQCSAPKKSRSIRAASPQRAAQSATSLQSAETTSDEHVVTPPAATQLAVATPKPALEPPGRLPSRYIPRAVVREVYARDGGQCTFVSPQGQRCTARGFLELHHHDTPYARGGAATVANLRLMCRAHNGLLAERELGNGFMPRKLRSRQAAPQSGEAAERALSGRSDLRNEELSSPFPPRAQLSDAALRR